MFRLFAAGRTSDAADLADRMDVRPTAALLRLAAGEALARGGLVPEARDQLGKAVAFWQSVGAAHYLAKAEAFAPTLVEAPVREKRPARA